MDRHKEDTQVFRRKLTRRAFLRNASAGIAGAALLGVVGCGAGEGGGNGEGGGGGNGGAEHSFRYGATQPPEYSSTREALAFADLVNERSDGRIEIEVFPSGQLGTGSELIEGAQSGSIAFTKASAAALSGFAQAYGVFDLPYLFNNTDHFLRYLETEDAQRLLGLLEPAGVIGLAHHDSGARSFYTGKLVEKPEDLAGLKIRIQESQVASDFMEALGASATALSFSEVYSALQTGVIDGAENNWPSYLSTSHYEVAPYYVTDQHTRVPLVTLVNQQTMNDLSEEDQEIIRKAAEDAATEEQSKWEADVEEARNEIEGNDNVTVTVVEDLTPWQEAVEPVIEKYRDQYSETLEAIDEAAAQ